MTYAIRVLLVSLYVTASLVASHCLQVQIPSANVEYAMLHIDSFSQVEDMGNAACESFGVPKYKCGNVKKEMLDAMQEMARRAVREAVVNVSLDRSLAYDVWMLNETTQEEIKAPEPLVVYPEQSLTDTISEYCARFNLDRQSCENAQAGVNDLLARDWGCNDKVKSTAEERKKSIEIPILLQEQKHQLELDMTSDGTVDVATFCIRQRIHVAECAALFRLAQEHLEGFHEKKHDEDDKDEDSSKNTGLRRQLRVNSPLSSRLYPKSERIYINVDWERSDPDLDAVPIPEEVCLHVDYSTTPLACFIVPQTDPLYVTPNSEEGYHIFHFTDKSGEKLLAARTFQVVTPTAELLEMFTSKSDTSLSKREYLVAKIRTTLFTPFDSAFRVCVILDGSFDCLDPEWMAVDEEELRHGTQTEPIHQSVTFHFPFDHVQFNHEKQHNISLLLLTESNKAIYLSETIAFNTASAVNSLDITSRLHILDPRLHTPQRPRFCPDVLRSVSNLRWICELWRHEWGLYSQNGEDGVLSKIFQHVGTANKSYVEFGTESGQECNTRLLRQIHGWKGLLMDARHEDASIELYREFITRENLMPLLAEKYRKLVPRDLDLLSIDVDFNDFWLLSALDLTRVTPRVIVVEVNSHIPPSEARTVPYDDRMDGSGGWDGFSSYFGGSVAAFHRWGALNGYSLVYCESHGVNCFLVHNDLLGGVNVSALLGPSQVQAPPNFFGQGWSYPESDKAHHKWVWI